MEKQEKNQLKDLLKKYLDSTPMDANQSSSANNIINMLDDSSENGTTKDGKTSSNKSATELNKNLEEANEFLKYVTNMYANALGKGGLAIGASNSFHFLATNDGVLSNTSKYHDVWNILPNGQVSILDGDYFTPADDSKVAHLYGANNFDTVPTVKNNPLLLASSLPSDLARTTKDANFTGKLKKSGIDVATKSDVTTAVSTATDNMADISKTNTFSKQQIFSTNPTNGTQVYPIYATVDTDADATTLIASLQSSGFSGMIGVPES